MKRFFAVGITYLVLIFPIRASDLLLTTPSAVNYGWTGFYGGVNAGYGFGRTGVTEDFVDSKTNGFIGGGQFGYNYQSSPNIVFGFQALFDGSDIRGHIVNSGIDYSGHVELFGNTSLRGGVLVNPQTLVFLSGGFNFIRNQVTVDNSGSLFTTTRTHTGPTVGIGVEIAPAPQERIFFSYNYYDGGSQSYLPGDENVHVRFSTITVGVNKPF
jgi:outer membrane immunogenic protein